MGLFPFGIGRMGRQYESFMKDQTLFSTLKLRAGYGVTGNQSAISPLNSLNLMAPSGLSEYNSQPSSLMPSSPTQIRFAMETKYTVVIGVDVTMLKGRLRFTADYYRSHTKDMLYTTRYPFLR
jgi:hypothetical protein